MSHVNVTSWSVRKRHLAEPNAGYTLCHTVAVRPGDNCVGQPLKQYHINALPLCKKCEKSSSLGAVPPAAEGGRPGGDGSGPLAAPRRDMPDEQTAALRRWYDALFLIASNPCSNGDPAVACPDEFGADRKRWCSYCIAADALNPRVPDEGVQR
ncbi:hypothetical protein [Nocardia abscessus]|uniref:hypothetical protein n=1 Tax=Nocardia abscessus TaxID=120957 RepID=UPI0012FA4E00|nr:hypothetical protein [Nocardia abscessus]MCC3333523.1 hypothetical protein [Nocardia abscessus]